VKAGLVTFDFPPQYTRADSAARPTAIGSPLAARLSARGITVAAPVADLAARDAGAAGGIRDGRDLSFCVEALRKESIDCLLIEVFHWARISLVAELVDRLDVPTAVVAVTAGGWNGVPCAGAVCGSIRESPRTRTTARIESFLEEDAETLASWMCGASAFSRMRRSRVMLWGGSYGAEMPYTRSDPAALERIFLREVMTEQEEVLVDRARQIVSGRRSRIDSFLAWLASNGAEVRRDEKMVTPAALDFQVGLYLAARDRLEELDAGREAGAPAVAAAAIKCHYEMSLTCQGCTACLLPAFLPFGEDAEGARRIVPFACEGDLNGVVTAALLHAVNPSVPPLFGDLVSFRKDHVLLRNCGGASVYWADRSLEPARSLPRVRLSANLHGKSGAAVNFETPAGGDVTFARLFRLDDRFRMLLGEGRIREAAEGSRYDDPWPHTRLDLGVDPAFLFRCIPCNHGTLTEGRLGAEIETACGFAGVPVSRCDDETSLRRLLAGRGTGEDRA
jgi:L-fucose isomerase-like protein